MIGVACNGIAFPIVWTMLDHGGGSGADEHAEVLGQFLRIEKPDQIRALVVDLEFTRSKVTPPFRVGLFCPYFSARIDRPLRPVNPQDSSPRFRAGHPLMTS